MKELRSVTQLYTNDSFEMNEAINEIQLRQNVV